MFDKNGELPASETKVGGRNDDFEIVGIGAYRAPELQQAGWATKRFSGYNYCR
jgi:hypothetical protein